MEHKYWYDGVPLNRSVTKVVEKYFEKFAPDIAIEKMIKGGNWPRPQYTDEDGKPFSSAVIKRMWDDNGELARNQGISATNKCPMYL
jgi:hypothetical protein